MHNALPVGKNLKVRNINNTIQCTHCGEAETITHLLFTCIFTAQIWRQIPCTKILMADQITNFSRGIEAAKLLINLPPVGIGEAHIFPLIIWAIWTTRNKKVLNSHHIQPQKALFQAIPSAREWQSNKIR